MIQDLIESALATSTADACIVIGSEHSEANLRWAANSLTTNGRMHSRSMTVISVRDDARVGIVSRSVTTEDEVTRLVRDSDAAAADATPAEDAMPLIGAGTATDPGWDAEPAETFIEVFDRFAADLGRTFEAWRSRDELLFGFAEHEVTSLFLASSTGLRRRADLPSGRLELNGKSADFRRSAFDGAHTRTFDDIDLPAIADGLTRRLEWARTSIELPPGRYETLLPPSAVGDLLVDAYWSMSARDAEEGRSVYSRAGGGTRIGDRLSALPLTLLSDPAYPGLETADFEVATSSDGSMQSVFDNGSPVGRTEWIRDGTLAELVRTRAWAQRTGSTPAHFVGNLVLDGGGTAGLDDMVAATGRGLLLTCLWYIREVDPQTLLLTGLTRDGVYLVEDGQVKGAVNNFRFNESPIDLLGRVTEAGRTQGCLPREMSDYFARVAMPPLRVPDFFMSTVSPAS